MVAREALVASSVAVFLSMALMFLLPRELFLAAAYLSTVCMFAATTALGGYRRLFAPKVWTIALGLASAAGLYAVFLAGNLAVQQLHPLGIGASNESSVYSLIVAQGAPAYLQLGVLVSDSVGYESFFRGALQGRLSGTFGVASPFIVAAIDAGLHVLSFNPLWVAATFIVDSGWGLTYHLTGDLSSSMLSHFAWDAAIFILFPIG